MASQAYWDEVIDTQADVLSDRDDRSQLNTRDATLIASLNIAATGAEVARLADAAERIADALEEINKSGSEV